MYGTLLAGTDWEGQNHLWRIIAKETKIEDPKSEKTKVTWNISLEEVRWNKIPKPLNPKGKYIEKKIVLTTFFVFESDIILYAPSRYNNNYAQNGMTTGPMIVQRPGTRVQAISANSLLNFLYYRNRYSGNLKSFTYGCHFWA